MKLSLALLALAMALAITPTVKATTFDFTYTAGPVWFGPTENYPAPVLPGQLLATGTLTGTLMTTPVYEFSAPGLATSGVYLITNGTIYLPTFGITGVLLSYPSTFLFTDPWPSFSELDDNGLIFQDSDGGLIQLDSGSGTPYAIDIWLPSANLTNDNGNATFTMVTTPEPSSLLLMLLGSGSAGLILWTRRNRALRV